MNSELRLLLAALCLITSPVVLAHGTANPDTTDAARLIEFPDTAAYKTIVLDPHTHSSFSDGHVWPNIRIGEALRDGLDAIAITEHLEYQPHLADVPHPDRNRAWQIAEEAAAGTDLVVIKGAEITRDAPVGHMNAIFIEDANKLYKAPMPGAPVDPGKNYVDAGQWPAQEAVQAANDQGAFVFWNHAYWPRGFPNGIAVIPKFHVDNARKKLLHGIEIANGDSYSEETFQIALDYDLTLIGVSDVHNLIDWDYSTHAGEHRPVTLVFATEHSNDAIKQALFDRRTVVWYKNILIGRPAHLAPLLDASLTIDSARYPKGSEILAVELTNHSDAHFQLLNKSKHTFYLDTDLISVPPHETTRVLVKTKTKVSSISLDFDVINTLVAPKKNARMSFKRTVE